MPMWMAGIGGTASGKRFDGEGRDAEWSRHEKSPSLESDGLEVLERRETLVEIYMISMMIALVTRGVNGSSRTRPWKVMYALAIGTVTVVDHGAACAWT